MNFVKKLVSIVLFSASLMVVFFLPSKHIDAAFYEASQNKVLEDSVLVSRSKDKVTVNIQYQNGISNVEVFICENSNNCNANNKLTWFVDDNIKLDGNNGGIVNSSENIATYSGEFFSPYEGTPIGQYSDKIVDGKVKNTYYIRVIANFCVTRSEDKTKCLVWDVNSDSTQKYNWGASFDLESGITSSGEINDTLGQMLNIVNNIVIPILWVALGILLIVRGIILGIDIVKSADEPEVRKKKINGLIWLVIGVFVGYLVSIGASIIMSTLGYGGLF